MRHGVDYRSKFQLCGEDRQRKSDPIFAQAQIFVQYEGKNSDDVHK
jgi:hypothetical protein